MAHPEALAQHWETVRTMSKPGQALAPQAPTATVRNPQWFTPQGNTWRPKNARKELHKQLITEHRDQYPRIKNERKAIILDAPPGAGKSTMLDQLLGHQREQFLVINADEFKKSLLQEAHHDGSYNSWILPDEVRQREAAGERFP